MINSKFNYSIKNSITLQEIIQKVHKLHNKESLESIEELTAQAAVQVLGTNIQPYTSGSKQITKKQCKKIKAEIVRFKDFKNKKVAQREKKFDSKLMHITEMMKRLRDYSANLDLTDQKAKNDLNADYQQILGCMVAYGTWKKGDIIPGSHEQLSNYQVQQVITNEKGLQLTVLVPMSKDGFSTPVICCRGTISDTHNYIDDLKKQIGNYSFEPSRDKILQTLQEVTKKFGPATLTGHSLGGSIAQTITAEFSDKKVENSDQLMIKSVYTFNAPGIQSSLVEKYKKNMANVAADKRSKVHRYYHAGDFVVLAGGSRLPADVVVEVDHYSVINLLLSPLKAIKKAHSLIKLISEYGKDEAARTVAPFSSLYQKFVRGVAERMRFLVGTIAKRVLLIRLKSLMKK